MRGVYSYKVFEVESKRIWILEEPDVVDDVWDIGLVSLVGGAVKCIAGVV
jgi:hypothetical protein